MAGKPQAGGFREIQDVAARGDRRLRIGLFTNNYFPLLGGVATAVETCRAELTRLGHEVIVVAPRMSGAQDEGRHILRVPAWPAPTYPDFALPLPLTPSLDRVVAGLALDVFHAQHPFLLGVSARRLARRLGRPLVFTYHTHYDKYAHHVPLPRALVARQAIRLSTAYANRADLVIAPSEALASQLRVQGVRRPVAVLPTGVDLGRIRPGDPGRARRRLGLASEGPLALYTGRLDREKNLDLLLDAFVRLLARHPHARLVLVGRGTREHALRARAVRAGAAERIRFIGGVAPPALADYYQAADLFLFTSTTETQGLAVLEAMASGLPVVAVRAPGVEEAVADGVAGILTAENAGALAEVAASVLSDPGLQAKLARGARDAAERFAAPALARRLAALYRQLVDGGGAAAA